MLNDSHDITPTHREDTNIRKVVFVSSKTKEGIPELINELVLGAKKHSFLKQVIPGSYFDLFQILQNMRKEGTSTTTHKQALSYRIPHIPLRLVADALSLLAGAQAHSSTISDLGSSENVLLTTGPLSVRKRDKKEYVRFINWDHMVRLGLSCKIEADSINEVVSFFHVR